MIGVTIGVTGQGLGDRGCGVVGAEYPWDGYRVDRRLIDRYRVDRCLLDRYSVDRYRVDRYSVDQYSVDRYSVDQAPQVGSDQNHPQKVMNQSSTQVREQPEPVDQKLHQNHQKK